MDKRVDGVVEVAPGLGQLAVWLRWRGVEVAESRLQDTGIGFSKKESQAAARSSKDVVMGTLEALNKAFASESAEVIGHLAAAVIRLTKMGSYQRTKSGISEAVGEVAELAQAGKERHDTGVTEAKTWSTLAVNKRRQHDLLKRGGTDGAVLTHALGIQETPVGLSADGAQVG